MTHSLSHLAAVCLTCLAAAHAAHPLDEWYEHAPLPTFRELQDLAHDGDQYILLDGDSNGRALISTDGKEFAWQDLGLPEPLEPTRILHANSSYLLVAGGRLWYRSAWEGGWDEAAGLNDGIVEIRATGNTFWAWSRGPVDRGPRDRAGVKSSTLYRSEDGRVWAQVDLTLGREPMLQLHDIIQSKGKFFLAGIDLKSLVGLWTSTDGVEWAPVEGMKAEFKTLCEGEGRILAGAYGGMLAHSSDGRNWSIEQLPFSSGSGGHEEAVWPTYHGIRQLICMEGRYQAFLGDGEFTSLLAESKNGAEWRYSTLGGDPHPGLRESLGTMSGKPVIVLVPDEEASSQSQNLHLEVTVPQGDGPKFNISDISKARKIGENLFLLGRQGKLWATVGSGEGFRSILPHAPWDWTTVSANDTRVIVAAKGGHFAWSEDAMTFHSHRLPEPADVNDSLWVPTLALFVAVGGKEQVGRTWFSEDGENWSVETLPGFTSPATGVTWDGTRLIACGGKGQLATSSDGMVWRIMDSAIEESLAAIEWADEQYVATSTEGLVFTSPDARTWKTLEVGHQGRAFEQIAHGNGVWMLADRDSQMAPRQSADFVNWSTNSNQSCNRIIHAFGEFIGTDGRRLVSSADGNLWLRHYDSYGRQNGFQSHAGFQSAARFRDRVVFAGFDGLIGTSGAWRDFFGEWQREHFNASELADPAASGPDADPDGDGWPNALEYALDYDPKQESRYGGWHARFDEKAGEYFFTNDSVIGAPPRADIQIQTPLGKKKAGVVVWAERSTDMVHWTRNDMRVYESRSARANSRLITIPAEFGARQVVRLRWRVVRP